MRRRCRNQDGRRDCETVTTPHFGETRTPSPGTPGDASGLGGCPRAGGGEGDFEHQVLGARNAGAPGTPNHPHPTLSRSTGRGNRRPGFYLLVAESSSPLEVSCRRCVRSPPSPSWPRTRRTSAGSVRPPATRVSAAARSVTCPAGGGTLWPRHPRRPGGESPRARRRPAARSPPPAPGRGNRRSAPSARRRSSRWATTAKRLLVNWYGSTPMSSSRATAPPGDAACSVQTSRCPDNAACTASDAVAGSRISPSISTCGSCRRMLRMPARTSAPRTA